jgi:peptide/nickel transport system permease protein
VLIVASLTQLNRAILTEATISFLGMGVKPPEPTWGNLLIGAQNYLWTAPWLAVVPGVAITVTLLAIFKLGDRGQHARLGGAARRVPDGQRRG